jgi:glucose/arabinose dehydrogenase
MKGIVVLLVVLFIAGCYGACTAPVASALVPTGFCASIWASSLNSPRGIITASNGDVIVVESGSGQLSLFYKDTSGSLQKVALASASGINHAVVIHGGFIYASSSSTVFRWPYTAGTRTNLGTPQTVISGIPTGGHSTRSLIFNTDGLLLVQIGSGSNVDNDASRAGIRQFDVSKTLPIAFSTGAWFVNGLRNEVGLRFDVKGNIWGVENGMDDLNRPDLGGDIHLGNPGEELNMFTPGKFYGYPFCWSQYNLSTVTTPRNTQYGLTQFLNDGTHTDKWCQNATNVVKPMYTLHPHTAPLDLLFYSGTSFPGYTGDLFVTQHGSWDSTPPVGYRVSRVHFEGGLPVSDDPFFWFSGPGQTGPNWHRPVALTLIENNGNDVLLVTSDATGVIIAIQYSPTVSMNIA